MLSFLKKLTSINHGGLRRMFFSTLLKRTKIDYRKEVGTGLDSSVVTGPIQWVQRSFHESPFEVLKVDSQGNQEPALDHKLKQLIDNPNPFYSGVDLFVATVLSYLISGNAYWLVISNSIGVPIQLWYVPHWQLEPRWPESGREFISHYEYKPSSSVDAQDIDVTDVVHFRNGINPNNPRLGLSPLDGVIREIFMDLEASNFSASLLRNMGVPGVVVTPKGDVVVDPEDVKATKKWLKENFTGDRRGEPMVMGAPTEVQQFGFDPKAMDLSASRNVAEERVCACLGIHSAVVGFGTGMQQTKVGATLEELSKLSWINGVIPVQNVFSGTIKRSLLPRFETRPESFKVGFDRSEVTALQEDENQRIDRLDKAVESGWLTVAEARERADMGLEVDDTHDIYLRPISTIEVPGETGRMEVPQAGQQPGQEGEPGKGKAAALKGHTHTHTLFEERIALRQSQQPTREQQLFIRSIELSEIALRSAMEEKLVPFFSRLGTKLSVIARDEIPKAHSSAETKQEGEDVLIAEQIIEQAQMALEAIEFKRIYEEHYLDVAQKVAEELGALGLSTNLADPIGRAVVATGGRRAGLVDLVKQTKDRLFRILTQARTEGAGVDQIVKQIEEQIPAGPWRDTQTRARVIARTETKFAQNVSVVEHGKDAGAQQFMIFDARIGDTDEICESLDGVVVTSDEALQLVSDEHPNGTRSFAPTF